MSTMRQPAFGDSVCKNSSALEKAVVSKPLECINRAMALRTDSSSSMMWTVLRPDRLSVASSKVTLTLPLHGNGQQLDLGEVLLDFGPMKQIGRRWNGERCSHRAGRIPARSANRTSSASEPARIFSITRAR